MAEHNYWTRLQRRALSRRTMLRGTAIAGAGLAGAALIGCGGDDDDDDGGGGAAEVIEGGGLEGSAAAADIETTEQAQLEWIFEQAPKNIPISGGTRVSTTSTGFDHFSPFHLGGAGTGYLGFDRLYERFFRGDNKLMLRAIENVERPDQVTNILTVRPGKFGPNPEPGIGERDVVAEDIFVAMRIKNEDITAWNPGLYYGSTDWDQTEITDDRTIKLILTRPRNDFFITSDVRFPSKEAGLMHLAGEKTLQQWDNPPGSGPYYQTDLTPGTKLTMTRNPGYARAPWPFIENREIINITDQNAVQAQFRAGVTLSWSPAGSNKILFDSVLEDLGGGTQPQVYGVKTPSRATGVSFGMSSALREPFNDVRFREAITRAVDRQRASDILTGGESLPTGPGIVSFFTDWHVPMDDPQLLDYLSFQPEKSAQLIDAVRADGLDVDREMKWLFRNDSQVEGDTATLGVQFFKEAGITNVRAEAYPGSEISSRVLRRATADFDFTATGGGPPDPGVQVRSLHTDAQYVAEAFCLCDPVYDAMVEDWEATSDEEEIARKAIEIQRFLMNNYSPVFFWYLGFQRTLYKSTFRNINPFENVSGHFSWIDESYLEG